MTKIHKTTERALVKRKVRGGVGAVSICPISFVLSFNINTTGLCSSANPRYNLLRTITCLHGNHFIESAVTRRCIGEQNVRLHSTRFIRRHKQKNKREKTNLGAI